ncbi:hypothetical protein [Roseibacillus ishigakijimensis]|uniref:Uncharacterized protein n=1 Tax=Roseibacillus ishigakijimensis TaxID=454146 RepID=A0A934RU67_9BACT|nr:hypothetical protein [Roseibacillus ishigakijimensis]MBK1834240.1 hypothetical protein [Roseibacillus ishigakijimensis]
MSTASPLSLSTLMLPFQRKKKKPAAGAADLQALVEQERAVREQIEKLEEMIAEAPDRIRREYEDARTTMPPPDDLEDRLREKRFQAHLTRGEVRNQQRYQVKATGLFVLLLLAIGSVISWILSFLSTLS